MKRLSVFFAAILIAGMSVSLTGCYGSFSLTKKVYNWNGGVGDKFVNEAVFLALNIIPVYGVCTFIDAVFLNTIEFWTGKKSLALKEGINKVNIKGKELTILLNKGNAVLYDNHNNELANLNYNSDNRTWYASIKGSTHKLMTIEENDVQLFTATGQTITVNKANLNSESTLLKFNECTAMK